MCILPRSTGLWDRLQVMDFGTPNRLHRCIKYREPKLRSIVHITNVVFKCSCEANPAEDKLFQDSEPKAKSIAGSVVALGKFDALHVGHRALAIQASKMGSPVLMSFTGMAEVLNWEKRLPIVAPCDRKRVMSLWTEFCGGIAPEEYRLEFAKVRSLSPHEFIEKLAKELHVKGVVAGVDYRFGYKAAGKASDLVDLCSKFALEVSIVNPVMDKTVRPNHVLKEAMEANSREKGQVSSTRVRKALSIGDVKRVAELLGRQHRIVFPVNECIVDVKKIILPSLSALNQIPSQGMYHSRICLSSDGVKETNLGHGSVQIEDKQIVVILNEIGSLENSNGQQFFCVDMLESVA